MVIRLIIITRNPTKKNILRMGSRDVSNAEKGAVTMPPISKPATMFQ